MRQTIADNSERQLTIADSCRQLQKTSENSRQCVRGRVCVCVCVAYACACASGFAYVRMCMLVCVCGECVCVCRRVCVDVCVCGSILSSQSAPVHALASFIAVLVLIAVALFFVRSCSVPCMKKTNFDVFELQYQHVCPARCISLHSHGLSRKTMEFCLGPRKHGVREPRSWQWGTG